MATSFRQESAKIYEFRAKIRTPFQAGRADGKPVAELRSQPLAEVEFGSGWYHGAAVQDADRLPKP